MNRPANMYSNMSGMSTGMSRGMPQGMPQGMPPGMSQGMPPPNSTMIDDLPDIDEFDTGNILPPGAPNVTKHMRQNHQPPPQSGMITRGKNYGNMGGAYNATHQVYDPEAAQMMRQQAQPPQYGEMIDDSGDNVNCREVCAHIRNCEVCAQIYRSDKSLYILAIIILAVICILLLKKVMDL